MPVTSIRDQLKKLVELQNIDLEIYGFKRELREKPLLLEDLRNKYEFSKQGLKKLEEKLKSIQVDRKSKELELQSKEELIVKSNMQLFSLKTNKEYQAKLLEMENIKADKSLIEEQILQSYDESDAAVSTIEKEKQIVAAAEKRYLEQKKEVEDSVKGIEEQIKQLDLKRRQITPEVEKAHLSRYEKILENKDGLALVPVKSGSCGGCFMHVPQQVISDIKMHERLVFCEMCARIIYLEDDL